MSALFACTRCAKRFSFEDLSEADQLCKECRNNYPIVKCTYCRVEFQQQDKNSVNSICKKCTHNVKSYGKPRACEYCCIIAAFIGKYCQRCANSERKWGTPRMCDQCKQQCAFDRGGNSRKQMDDKLLCWLCTMASKRVIQKALRNAPEALTGTGTPSSKKGTPQDKSRTTTPYSPGTGTPYSPSTGAQAKTDNSTDAASSSKIKNKENGSSSSGKPYSKSLPKHKREREKAAFKRDSSSKESKKAKLDKSSSNGATGPNSKSGAVDLNSSENMVIITQLREELEALKKQVAIKDQQILDRDKKLTELKADNFEFDSNMRKKIQNMQKVHLEAAESLQNKNRDLSRQLAILQKQQQKSMKKVSSSSSLSNMALTNAAASSTPPVAATGSADSS